MAQFEFFMLKKDDTDALGAPVNIALADKKAIEKAGLTLQEGAQRMADTLNDTMAINIFDLDAITTTSDGLIVRGAIVKACSADRGVINPEFGTMDMVEMTLDDPELAEEPHMKYAQKLYAGRSLYRGPDPKVKLIPVHNATITGRCVNNNSATEVMDAITMREMLIPILGQIAALKGEDVLIGLTGEIVSVAIGMVVCEKYGRILGRTRSYQAGQTAHRSGKYAKTLKVHIPCIASDKATLAAYILDALENDCVPGRDVACAPAIMEVARAGHFPIATDNIAPEAWEELESVGFSREWAEAPLGEKLTREQIIARADEIISGFEGAKRVNSRSLYKSMQA
jgi:hypothetical protein